MFYQTKDAWRCSLRSCANHRTIAISGMRLSYCLALCRNAARVWLPPMKIVGLVWRRGVAAFRKKGGILFLTATLFENHTKNVSWSVYPPKCLQTCLGAIFPSKVFRKCLETSGYLKGTKGAENLALRNVMDPVWVILYGITLHVRHMWPLFLRYQAPCTCYEPPVIIGKGQ